MAVGLQVKGGEHFVAVGHTASRLIECRAGTGAPKFMFKDGSKWLPGGGGFFASLVVYDVSNGIGSVEQKVGGSWTTLSNMNDLGQQFILQQPANYRSYTSRNFDIRVTDVNGLEYGTYNVKWPCGDSVCGSYTDAST